jgi:cysteine desulfurase
MELKQPIYLDHNATTAMDPRVLETMLPYFTEKFGNAAVRQHSFGWTAATAVDEARGQVAELINATPGEIIFTSGATESINLAIKGVFERYAVKGNHIITCVTEHKAVLDTCAYLEALGARITYLPVQPNGLIDPGMLEAAITPATILIAIMYANNETGVLQHVKQISGIARKHDVFFFSDATQAAGKIPVDVAADGIDLLAFSAHKIYGPKGIGALYVRRKDPRVSLAPQIHGGGHERNIRSGTLNVPAIAGFGKACHLCRDEMKTDTARLQPLRDRLEQALLAAGNAFVNGHATQRLPYMTNISFGGISGKGIVAGLHRTIALSAGSACNSALPEPSYVLRAMGRSEDLSYNALRMGLGRFNTEAEINEAIHAITAAVSGLRATDPLQPLTMNNILSH